MPYRFVSANGGMRTQATIVARRPAGVRGRALVVGSPDPPLASRHGAGPPRPSPHTATEHQQHDQIHRAVTHSWTLHDDTPSAVRTHHDHGELTPTVNRCAYRPLQLGTLLRASFWARPRRRVLQHAEQTLQYLHRRFVARHCCDRRHFVRRGLHLHAQPAPGLTAGVHILGNRV
jgi:hypothetical protein